MRNRPAQAWKLLTWLAVAAIAFPLFLPPAQVLAQAEQADGWAAAPAGAAAVAVTQGAGSATIALNLGSVSGASAGASASGAALAAVQDAALAALPRQRFGGYELPMQLVTLALPGAPIADLPVQAVTASPYAGELAPAAPLTPPALDAALESHTPEEMLKLPTQPLFVLRSGYIHGRAYAVVAVSPLYAQDGAVRLATEAQATLPGVVVANADLLAGTDSRPATQRAEVVNVPVNAAALANSYKITVVSPGLQEVTYAELGLETEPAALRLMREGAPVAVEKLADRLRFYAPGAGDRWSATSTYWLTLENGPIMATLPAAPDAAPGVAFAQGRWNQRKLYDSFYPGEDGSHWFNAELRVDATITPTAYPTASVAVMPVLPLADGESTFTVNATAFVRAPGSLCLNGDKGYKLEALMHSGPNNVDSPTVAWDPAPDCILAPSSALTFTTSAKVDSLLLRLLPNDLYPTGIKLQSVDWRRPVRLDFAGLTTPNIDFWTQPEAATYTWSNLPTLTPPPTTTNSLYLPLISNPNATSAGASSARLSARTGTATGDWQLYDITDPASPALVPINATGFNQDAGAASRHYLLANVVAPLRPTVTQHSAVDFGNVKQADAIYIGPGHFAAGLQPLLDLRAKQGFTPIFVDVQSIYDVYSYGQVSAVAIRNFLRQQSDWQNTARKLAVVLAGDATYDPFGYEGVKNDILVAAWMDDVDPFMGETACDACIAQLNGDDPKTGDNTAAGAWFAADVWLGRLPVRTAAEVANVVSKIVDYETTGSDADPWRARKVFLADNYIKSLDGEFNAKLDEAGDFAALSDAVISHLGQGSTAQRVYYDPAPERVVQSNSNGPIPNPGKPGYYLTAARTAPESWRIGDAAAANAAAINSLTGGAGMLVYNGHANHFQFATTSENPRLWLLYTNDVDVINNTGRPFVQLSMTCYTSQFVKPTVNGTLDELLFRRKNAGAVAVWGPTGQSVVNGHQLLQEGFMMSLYGNETGSQAGSQTGSQTGSHRMGVLTEAGYTNLLLSNTSNLDPLMTFVLLGDPLTTARISTRTLFLPSILK